MSMSDQPDPVKQNIVDWFQEDSITCKDISDKNPSFTWILEVGTQATVLIFKLPNYPNRIYFRTMTNLISEHVKLLAEDAKKKGSIQFKIHTLAVQLEVNPTFKNDDKEQFNAIWISKIHYNSSIKKADLLEKFVRIQQCQNVVLNNLNKELGISIQSQNIPDAPDASDVGIL